jgi:hypothetical protein
MVLWGFLASVVSEACTAFTESEGIVRAVRMPFFLFAQRLLIRNVLVLAHNILVIAVVDAVFQVWPGWHGLLAIPGLLLWGIDSLALVLLFGTFCARFRDILPIVASVMQIAFFMSPVIWTPEQLGRARRCCHATLSSTCWRSCGRRCWAHRLACMSGWGPGCTALSCGASRGACSVAPAAASHSGSEHATVAVNNPHILIEGVSVFFPLYHGNARSLKKTVVAAASGRLGRTFSIA